jgi:hypothetical protein
MQGPSSRCYELTDPVAAATAWRREAARYQEIAEEAHGAALRTWDRGEVRACEVAIQTAEAAVRWCRACVTHALAAAEDAWCEMLEERTPATMQTYSQAHAAAHGASARLELARIALSGCVGIRRLGQTVSGCEADTVCAGAVTE